MKQVKKPIYKRVWFWVIIGVIALSGIAIQAKVKYDQRKFDEKMQLWEDTGNDKYLFEALHE